MGRMIGILLMVLGVWVGVEVYSHGVQGAFGGALSGLGGQPREERREAISVPQRAGAAVQRAHGEADERRNRLLEEQAKPARGGA